MKQFISILILAMTSSLTMAGETFVELGSVALNTTVKQSVTFKNADLRNPVRIEKVESSCECLRVLDYPAEIAPGASVKRVSPPNSLFLN